MNKALIKCLYLSSIILLVSCFAVKPTTSKYGGKHYETFFVGDEGTQYFIKPISFENRQSNEKLICDITFRYNTQLIDSAVINFSVVGPKIYKSMDMLLISSGSGTVKSDDVRYLFSEPSGDGYSSRFSSKIAMTDLFPVINTESWHTEILHKEVKTAFMPVSKTLKVQKELHDRLLVILAAE